MNYEETSREDFDAMEEQAKAPVQTDIPVADAPDEVANALLPAETVAEDEGYLNIVFSKPYDFEGEVYKGVDLSGLEDIRGRQLTAIEKAFGKTGIVTTMPETTSTYAKIAATAATGLPAEFFEDLPGKELRKIKTAVTRFFYEDD